MSLSPPLVPPPTPPPAASPAGVRRPHVFPNLRQAFLLLLLFGAITLVIVAALHPLRQRVSDQLWFFLVVLLGEGLGVLCGLRLARWPLRRAFATLGFSSRTLRSLLAIALGDLLLIGSLLFLLTLVFGRVENEFLVELLTAESASDFLLLFLTIVIAAPLLEEVLVRGILLRGLATSWGVAGGVVWSAFFFALLHVNLLQAGPAFVNGLVWGVVLLRTGSLGATLFLHSLNNAVVFLLVQVALRAPDGLEAELAGRLQEPLELRLAAIVAVGMVGLSLLLKAMRTLPRAPHRLAAFWALPVPAAASHSLAAPATSQEPWSGSSA